MFGSKYAGEEVKSSLRFVKKTTSYGIEKKIYLLYIFPPELHTLMTSLF
jgi:hypothetical protein